MIMYVLEFAAKMPQQCFNKPAQRLRFGYRMTFHGIFTPLSQYRKSPVLYLRRQIGAFHDRNQTRQGSCHVGHPPRIEMVEGREANRFLKYAPAIR